MPYLNKSHFVLALAESFHYAIDAIAWESEYHVDTPGVNSLDENI
jgi:hypothetical protein